MNSRKKNLTFLLTRTVLLALVLFDAWTDISILRETLFEEKIELVTTNVTVDSETLESKTKCIDNANNETLKGMNEKLDKARVSTKIIS